MISGYNMWRKDRRDRRGGGVMIIVQSGEKITKADL